MGDYVPYIYGKFSGYYIPIAIFLWLQIELDWSVDIDDFAIQAGLKYFSIAQDPKNGELSEVSIMFDWTQLDY